VVVVEKEAMVRHGLGRQVVAEVGGPSIGEEVEMRRTCRLSCHRRTPAGQAQELVHLEAVVAQHALEERGKVPGSRLPRLRIVRTDSVHGQERVEEQYEEHPLKLSLAVVE
jgi:hypothetical protein